jgi:hypothetical protein
VKDMTKDNLDNGRELLIVVLRRDKDVGEWGCVTRLRVSTRHAVGLPFAESAGTRVCRGRRRIGSRLRC